MPNAPAPVFPGITAPSTDFAALIDGRRATLFVYELDLSTARSFAAGTAVQLKLTGNTVFVDQASDVGNVTMIFEGVQDDTGPLIRPAIYVQPGFIAKIPFANLRVANTAQTGKKLRIFYGVDVDFVPSVNASVAITGNVNAVNYGATYQTSYKSTTLLAANTPDTIFSPGANVNGAIVWSAGGFTRGTALGTSFLAKSSAPTNILDGDPITQVALGENSTDVWANHSLPNPIFIGAGKGLYYISPALEVVAYRTALYTLL